MVLPRRVVSLSPNVSMILFALQADALVVGRTQTCVTAIEQYLRAWDIPPQTVAPRLDAWQAIPAVGAWPVADYEAIAALRPEAILTSGSGPYGVHEAHRLGVEPAALWHGDTRTFADLTQHIQQLGALVGYAEAASALSAQLARRCEDACATPRRWPHAPTVLFEYCVCTQYDPDPERRVAQAAETVLVGGHLAPELIALSGGRTLFVQPGDTARWVTRVEIQAAQPEVILQYDCHGCPTARRQPIATRPGWERLPAVARAAVYPLSANISDPNMCFPEALMHLDAIFRADGPERS